MPADIQISTSLSGLNDVQKNLKNIQDSLKNVSTANDNLRKSTQGLTKASDTLTKATNDNTKAYQGLNKEASALTKTMDGLTAGWKKFIEQLKDGQRNVSAHVSGTGKLGKSLGKLSLGVRDTISVFGKFFLLIRDLTIKGLEKLAKGLAIVSKTASAMGGVFLRLGGILTAGITVPLGLAARTLVGFGAEAQRSSVLFKAKLGDMAAEASIFVDLMVNKFGQARTAMQDSVAALNNFAVSVGIGRKVALSMSTALTALTLDLSALFGVSQGEIFSDFLSTLVGNVIPSLKTMGIVVTAQTVKNKGLELGLKGLSTQWSLQQKVLLRNILILEGAQRSLGGFARSMNNPIIQAKIFSNQMTNLRQEIGLKLLPIMNRLTRFFGSLVPQITGLADKFLALSASTQAWVIGIIAAIAALGPMMLLLGGLFKLVALVSAAFSVLAGLLAAFLGLKGLGDIPLLGTLLTILGFITKIAAGWLLVNIAMDTFFTVSGFNLDEYKLKLAQVRLAIAEIVPDFLREDKTGSFIKELTKDVENLQVVVDKRFGRSLAEIVEEQIEDEFGGLIEKTKALGGMLFEGLMEGVESLKDSAPDFLSNLIEGGPFGEIIAKFTSDAAAAGIEIKELADEMIRLNNEAIAIATKGLQELPLELTAKQAAKAAKEFNTFITSMRRTAAETDLLRQSLDFAAAGFAKIDAAKKAGILTTQELISMELELKEALKRLTEKPMKDLLQGLELNNIAIRDNIALLKVKIKGDKAEIAATEVNIQLKTILARLRLTNAIGMDEEVDGLEELLKIQAKLSTELTSQQKLMEAQKNLLEPFKQAAQSIQSLFSDTFEEILSGGIDSFESFASSIKSVFIKLAAEIAALMIFRPAFGSIVGSLFGGGTATSLGLPGGGGFPNVSNFGSRGASTASGASSFGGIGSMLSGLSSTFSQFGTDLQQFFGIGSFGAATVSGGNLTGAFSPRPGRPGQPQAAGISPFGFSTMGVLGGALMGAGVGSLTGSLTGGNSTGSAIGGALGGGLGSFFGPLGSLAGGALGGAVGGLFGGNDLPDFSFISGAITSQGNNQFGTGTLGSKNASLAEAQKFIQGAANALGDIVKALDIDFTGTGSLGAISKERKGFVVIQPSGGRETFATAEEAINQFIVNALSASGAISGANSDLIRSSLTLSGGDLNRLGSDVQFGEDLRRAVENLELSELEIELRDISEAFDEMKELAVELGGTLPGLVDTLRNADFQGRLTDFTKFIRQTILGITDPLALALEQFEEIAQTRLDIAKGLGADLVAVEELNALQRSQVIARFPDELGDFTKFIRQTILGTTDPLALALEQFEEIAQDRLDIAKELGADLVAVEELNALQRTQVIAQFSTNITAVLRGTFAQLASGLAAITGREALGRSLTSLQGSIAFASQGQRSESLDLARLTSTLLDIAIDEGFAHGGERIFTKPSLISVAERGAERVSVRPLGSGTSGASGITVVFEGINVIDDLSLVAFERKIQSAAAKIDKGFV